MKLPRNSKSVPPLFEFTITARGARYRSLAEPWADTTTEFGEVLAAIVGYIGRKTREDILRRTTAGRARARANGVKFGRKPKLNEAQQWSVLERCHSGENIKSIARSMGVGASTISRLKKGSEMKPAERDRSRRAKCEAIGARLKSRRNELGLTQMMLAQAIGVSYQQLQKYEKGADRLSVIFLCELSVLLHVSITYFVEGMA